MNELLDISSIVYLRKLLHLDLSNNPVTNYYLVSNLPELMHLNLAGCKVSEIDFLEPLHKLKVLNLGNSMVSNYSILSSKIKLTELNLNSSNVTDIRFIRSLKSLIKLNLAGNRIDSLEHFLELTNLKELDIRQNKISNIMPIIGLTRLEILNISGNRLKSIDVIQELKKLRNLDVSYNQISLLQINKQYKSLTYLNISNNSVEDLNFLQHLTNLSSVYLANNNVQNLSALKALEQLRYLNVCNNYIEDISEFKFILKLPNVSVTANNNPCFSDLQLILNDNENHYKLIANELRKLDDEQIKAYLPEKVILLGNHAAGKSSLLYFLQKRKAGYNEDSTHILQIQNYPEKFERLPKAIVYDFGGQDFYHGVYKAFLTSEALTFLVWRSSTNQCRLALDSNGHPNRDFDIHYWMGQRKKGDITGEVILVQTHFDEESKSFPRASYINDYPEIEGEFHILMIYAQVF